ncbi:MAG: hypothetical protein ACPIOQ_77915 [Promethearchaeia archaeon]
MRSACRAEHRPRAVEAACGHRKAGVTVTAEMCGQDHANPAAGPTHAAARRVAGLITAAILKSLN